MKRSLSALVEDVTTGGKVTLDKRYNMWNAGWNCSVQDYLHLNELNLNYHIASPRIPDIEVGNRLLELNEENVERLVQSIRKFGLLVPVGVQMVNHRDRQHTYRLVYGAHRLEAINRLLPEMRVKAREAGMSEYDIEGTFGAFQIPAIVFNPKATPAQMRAIEAAENLHRQQLVGEQAAKLAKYLTKSAPVATATELIRENGVSGLARLQAEAEAKAAEQQAKRAEGISETAAVSEINELRRNRGNYAKPSLISVIAEKKVEKERPELTGEEKAYAVKKKAVVLRRDISAAAEELAIELPKDEAGQTAFTPEAIISIAEATQRVAEDEKYADEVDKRVDERKAKSTAKRQAAKASQKVQEHVKVAAAEKGRPELAEKIATAEDKRAATVEVCEELGRPVYQTCTVALHWPPEQIAMSLLKAYGRTAGAAVAKVILDWCRNNPGADKPE